jgi:hypothetical protein
MKLKNNCKKGRPKGTGKYGFETKPIRVPIFLLEKILKFIKNEIRSKKDK